MNSTSAFRVVLIGGGTAGITVAARLKRLGVKDVALIEPSSKHYYQPLWTLVGAGEARAEASVREEADFIPEGTRWIQERAEEIDPVEVRGSAREAVFQVPRPEGGVQEEVVGYDMLHVTPPQSAPAFIQRSPLAWQEGPNKGWVKADKYTLQHPDYPEVFSLGDASDLPTSRTGAAIRKQAPVLVENLLAVMAGRELKARYDGYASCPLTTAYGKLLLAEFDYEGKPTPSFPLIDTMRERRDMWVMKKYGLPQLYWQLMLRGRA